MTERLKTVAAVVLLSVTAVVATATPAGAQQLIDATTQGGEAFVAFTVMVVIFAVTLFYMTVSGSGATNTRGAGPPRELPPRSAGVGRRRPADPTPGRCIDPRGRWHREPES